MKKFNTILSFASLVFTSFLLVFLIFAWYATNKTANVNNAVGSVADIDNIVDKVEYYNFQSYNSSTHTYTVRQYVKHQLGEHEDKTQIRYYNNNGTQVDNPNTNENNLDGYDGHFEMNQFDYLKQGFSKYLVKITLKPGENLGALQFLSSASYFIGFENNGNGALTSSIDNLSMSSVIKFSYLTAAPTIGTNHSTVTIATDPSDDPDDQEAVDHYQHFDYTNDGVEYNGAISSSKKTIASNLTPAENTSLVIHVLVDYNINALNAFYGYNLSTSGGWTSLDPSAPQFTNLDFKIFILG